MTSVMMRLGDFVFSVGTASYQTFQRSTAYRWQAQERCGREPAQQFTGPGEDSITLEGVVYPEFAGAGVGQIEAMRKQAGKGLPLLLVDGNGYVWDEWVILSIDETQDNFLPGGVARKMAFTMKITKYGGD